VTESRVAIAHALYQDARVQTGTSERIARSPKGGGKGAEKSAGKRKPSAPERIAETPKNEGTSARPN